MVAGRRAVPDLPAILRGFRRRRDRRPARDPGAFGPSRVARDRRDLAEPDDAVAQRRLGLRRLRLLRGASRAGHDRGPRCAHRCRGGARDPRAARPRPEPHERSPRVVRRRRERARRALPRLLRLGRSGGGRRAAEQLGVQLRRLGLAAARADGPVLPEQLPAQPARPQLVERRRARGVRRRAAVLVRPRDRRLPDRRLPRDRQGPRAARRPCRDARRPPADPQEGSQAGVLDEPSRGPRRAPALARARGRAGPAPGAGGGDVRARPRLP